MHPRIPAFLSFEPWPKPGTLAEQLLTERRKRRGWSRRRATNVLGVDEGTGDVGTEEGHRACGIGPSRPPTSAGATLQS